MNTRAMWISAVIAGVVMALLAELPVISLFNCICCAWLWGGGILSVFLYRQFSKTQPMLSIAQGLGLGALSGAIGALIGGVMNVLLGPIHQMVLRAISGLLDRETNRLMGQIPMLNSPGLLMSIGENLVTYILFGAIGGLLAVALIWKPVKVAVVQPPVPPPPETPAQ